MLIGKGHVWIIFHSFWKDGAIGFTIFIFHKCSVNLFNTQLSCNRHSVTGSEVASCLSRSWSAGEDDWPLLAEVSVGSSGSVTLADAKGLFNPRLSKHKHTLLRTKSVPRTELNTLPYRSDTTLVANRDLCEGLGWSSINFSSQRLGLWWFWTKHGLGAALGKLYLNTSRVPSLQSSLRMHAELATPLKVDTLTEEHGCTQPSCVLRNFKTINTFPLEELTAEFQCSAQLPLHSCCLVLYVMHAIYNLVIAINAHIDFYVQLLWTFNLMMTSLFYFSCIHVGTCMYVCTPCASLMFLEVKRLCPSLWRGSYWHSWAALWVLGSKSRSSVKSHTCSQPLSHLCSLLSLYKFKQENVLFSFENFYEMMEKNLSLFVCVFMDVEATGWHWMSSSVTLHHNKSSILCVHQHVSCSVWQMTTCWGQISPPTTGVTGLEFMLRVFSPTLQMLSSSVYCNRTLVHVGGCNRNTRGRPQPSSKYFS